MVTLRKHCKPDPIEQLQQSVDGLARKLAKLTKAVENLQMTQQEMAAKLTTVSDQLTKIGTETTKLLADVADLKTQLTNGPVTPELQAAFDKVAAQAQTVDDLVPDAPTP